jgi:uncharacterized membrane protein SpoIIM required for sporulation
LARDVEDFVREREPRWHSLEVLLTRAEESPPSELGPENLLEVVRLYRLSCSDLNQLRSLTANPQLLGRVNQLVGRGYRFVYQHPKVRPGLPAVRRFFLRDVPATFRTEMRWVLSAALALLLGAAVGFCAVVVEPDSARSLIPGDFFTESASNRVHHIEHDKERIDNTEKATAFGAFLYTHNIQVAFLTFSLGALTLVLGWAMLFYNGLLLGAVAAQYLVDGVGTFFLAWVGPHGALELPALVFAAAAGLRAGSALLLPGEVGRAAAVRAAFPSVWRMLLTSAFLLVLAGLIEGSFSQFSSRAVPYGVKIAFALVLFTAMVAWLFGVLPERRRGRP